MVYGKFALRLKEDWAGDSSRTGPECHSSKLNIETEMLDVEQLWKTVNVGLQPSFHVPTDRMTMTRRRKVRRCCFRCILCPNLFAHSLTRKRLVCNDAVQNSGFMKSSLQNAFRSATGGTGLHRNARGIGPRPHPPLIEKHSDKCTKYLLLNTWKFVSIG